MGLVFSNIPELEGTDTEISLSNLSSLETELARIYERRLAHICELSRAMVNDGGDIDLVKSIIMSIRSDGEFIFEDMYPENHFEVSTVFSSLSHIERLIIFKQVFNEMGTEKYNFFEIDNEIVFSGAENRIAYVKNSYNDTVFNVFSSFLNDAKASYYDNFSDVCKSIIDGRCQFCILPVETMRDGKLISFYDQIIKNDLKINAEYDLESGSEKGYTRYALLSKTSLQTDNMVNLKGNKKCLEIIYSDIDNISLSDLFNAADFFSLKVDSADTFIFDNETKKKNYCVVFDADNGDPQMFMTYLSVDMPDHIFIGLYRRIINIIQK